jgi:[methyl-Co(III) methanol-specific corrinoid protein]:coenzyme M methyltransferase
LNPYDRLLTVLEGRRDQVDRLPCINSVSTCTVGFMRAYDAFWPASHKDPEKMAKLASAAHRLCGLDIVTVPFDTTVEAEVLGAPIDFHDGDLRWPSAKHPVLRDLSVPTIPKDALQNGRIPIIVKAIKKLKDEFGGEVPVNAYVVPPFTSISNYLADSMFFLIGLIREPEKIQELLLGTVDLYIEIARKYQEAGADIITLHEMGASCNSISPAHFERFVEPCIKKIVSSLKVPTILNICGTVPLIINKMVECGANAIAIDERTSVRKVKENLEDPKYPIIGNVSPRSVIHPGPAQRIEEAVARVIEEGVDVVAPGCDFYLETPTENIKTFVDSARKFGRVEPEKDGLQ